MPPKKRPKGVLPGAKLGRPFGRKPSCREAEVQTDAEFGILLESVSALSAGESSVGDRGKGDSAVLLRRQNILMMQLRKISKQNREMRTVIAKYEQIPNLLQAIKVHYESTFNSIKDDIAMLVFEQQNRGTKLMDHMQKQKCSIERLIAAKDEKLKAKEEKNNALKDEKKLLNEGLGYLQEALELEQRRVQVAVKEQCNALDEMQEIRLKMEDKLFLAANQRCSTCQTRERVQDELTDQIAGKLHQIEEFRKLLLMKDDAIAEKDRINELLISDLVKKRGECNDKTFAAKSYQSELANQLRKLKQAQIEIQQLRTMVPSSNCTSHEQQPNPHILTPPEEENGPPFVPLPCVAKVTMPTNGRSEQQQQISKKNEQNTMGKVSMNQNIEGRNGQNAKPKRNSREEELSLSVFVGKRPRVVSTANHGNGPVGLDNGGDGTVSAKGGQDNATTGGVNLSTAGGKEPNDRRKGEEVTERFFSPPPLKRKNSNNVLPAPPPPQIQQQQQMTARLTTTAPENIGQFQQRKKTEQQQGGGIVSKSWRPMDQQLPAPQKPQQSFAASQIQHPQQHQQLQQQLLRNSLPPVGPTTSPKLTTPTSHHNNSSSFRKYGGATIDDFCGGPKATSFNNNSNGRTALPVSGGGAELVSGTWRKSVPGSSFINRPTDTHPNAFINHQMRERIEQNICGAIASCAGASNPTTASVAAALPPMYACQQQKIPPPRPSAPIPRPPVRPFARQPTINSVNQFAAQTLTHQQQNGGGTARGISSLPWHSHSSGTFPCTTSQQSQHYSTSQFFIR